MTELTERSILTRDRLRLHVQIVGSGADVVVVPFAAALADALGPIGTGRTAIFYDMRGRGRSESLPAPSRAGFERDLDDLEDVRAHFQFDRISVVGFSYLGAVASTYAARFPHRVATLVLLGAIGPRAADAPPPIDQ